MDDRDTVRDLQEANESLEEAFYHLYWLRMSLVRARHYITEAQATLVKGGKGQDKGKGKGKSNDGKGKDGKGKGKDGEDGKGKGKDGEDGKGKGYGKAGSSHNLRILLIYLLRSLCGQDAGHHESMVSSILSSGKLDHNFPGGRGSSSSRTEPFNYFRPPTPGIPVRYQGTGGVTNTPTTPDP